MARAAPQRSPGRVAARPSSGVRGRILVEEVGAEPGARAAPDPAAAALRRPARRGRGPHPPGRTPVSAALRRPGLHRPGTQQLRQLLTRLPGPGPRARTASRSWSSAVGRVSASRPWPCAPRTVTSGFPDGQLHLDLAGTATTPRKPSTCCPSCCVPLASPTLPARVPERPHSCGPRSPGAACARARRRRVRRAGRAAAARCRRVRGARRPAASCCRTWSARIPSSWTCWVSRRRRGCCPASWAWPGPAPNRRARRPSCGSAGGCRSRSEWRAPLGRPAWTLRILADRLRDERRARRAVRRRPGGAGQRQSQLRVLPGVAARGFRLLGLLGPVRWPGWVVAALLVTARADDVLDTLVDGNLLRPAGSTAPASPRYRLHDLLRTFALEGSADHPGGGAAGGGAPAAGPPGVDPGRPRAAEPAAAEPVPGAAPGQARTRLSPLWTV